MAWLKFTAQSWPPIMIRGEYVTWPLATESRERIPWAIRNQRRIEGKTVLEAKEEAATICDAALAFLARNTLGRHESATKERANHDRVGPLLNLPVADLVDFVQTEFIAKGHTATRPVLDEFTQTKWKLYWDSRNLFHEDVIRWLLRPEVQVAAFGGESRGHMQHYLRSISVDVQWPDGSKVRADQADFATQVGLAAVHAVELMLRDPYRLLGLMVQMSLAHQPAVVEACRLTAEALHEKWRSLFIWFDEGAYDFSDEDQRIVTAGWSHLAYGVMNLVDGYVINRALYSHVKPRNHPIWADQSNEFPPSIFMPAYIMAAGYEAIVDRPSMVASPAKVEQRLEREREWEHRGERITQPGRGPSPPIQDIRLPDEEPTHEWPDGAFDEWT